MAVAAATVSSPTLTAAIAYASRGWRVLLLWWIKPDGTCACGAIPCPQAGKHPLAEACPKGCHSATTDAAVITEWLTRWPLANIGIATGQDSGIWVLDVDPRHGGHVTLEALEYRHGKLPSSIRQRTGSGGEHIIWKHPGDGRLSNSAGRLGPGLDVRADGGYIVAPPSNHASGNLYAWLDEDESVLEAAPEWLLEMIGERYQDDAVISDDDIVPIPDEEAAPVTSRKLRQAAKRMREGLSRHQTTVWLFTQLRDNRVSRAVAAAQIDVLLSVANESGDHPFKRAEASKILSWAYTKHPRKPDDAPRPDVAAIAAESDDIKRHKLIREMAESEGVPITAVKSSVAAARAATSPAIAPDDWRSRLLWQQLENGGQRLVKCLTNVAVMLECHPVWAGRLKWNELSRQAELLPGSPIDAPTGPWTDRHTAETTVWLQSHGALLVPPPMVPDGITLAASSRPYHPIRQYLDGLVWDGEERLSDWLEDLTGVARTVYSRAVGRKWMISAVARAYRPGCKVDHVLILEGKQGKGKSTLLSILANPWFGDELDIMGTKDAAMQTDGVWVIEIAELDSLRHSDLSRTKAFVTRTTDRFRPPYGRFVEERPRGCVFAGSVNDSQYLRDDSGGRRFWPVFCTDIDIDGALKTRDQLWAEATVAYRAGEDWWLSGEDEIAESEKEQDRRFQEDAWEERIAEALQPHIWKPHEPVTVANVLSAIGVDTAKQGRADQMRVAACLKRLGRHLSQTMVDGVRLRVWVTQKTGFDS